MVGRGWTLAAALALTACQAAAVPAPAPGPKASPRPVVTKAGPSAEPSATPATPPIAPARQAAFVRSLHDALPVSLASRGLGSLGAAASLIGNNGAGVLSNNGAGYRLAQLASAPPFRIGDLTRVRPDGVLRQKPATPTTGRFEIYDPKTWDGSEDPARLLDAFTYEVTGFAPTEDGGLAIEIVLTVERSRRFPFVDHIDAHLTGRFHPVTRLYVMEGLVFAMAFDVALADGTTDRAAITLTAGPGDLARERLPDGTEIPGTEGPARMALAGGNGHGTYGGTVHFRPGGDVEAELTHDRDGGGRTSGTLALRADGSQAQVVLSEGARLALETLRRPDQPPAYAVEDRAGAVPIRLPGGIVQEAYGIATFDFGDGEPVRARLY